MGKDLLVDLEKFLSLCTVHIYWLDRDNVYQGCNEKQAISAGLSSRFDIIGKRNCDLLWNKNHPEMVKFLDNINLEVMSTGVPRVVEEPTVLFDGTEAVFLSNKIPLRDDNTDKVVGLLGISVDITSQKLQETRLRAEKKETAFTLDYILAHIPAHIYWKDKNGIYLGSNDKQAESLGFNYGYELVSKTDFDLPGGKNNAVRFRENDLEVMNSGVIKIIEELAIFDGKDAIVLSQKMPLRNSCGEITGVLGISIDITDRKRAEHLKLETELQKNKLQEQEVFRQIANQVAHDIRSPLTSLSIIAEACKNIPEDDRITLRKIATRIGDIANNLLSKYRPDEDETYTVAQAAQSVAVSLALSEILSEKKYQYKHSPVKFTYSVEPDSDFAFIKVEPVHFKRMISNLINNAVEAFESKVCKVDLVLKSNDKFIEIVIQDNGKGISQNIIDKIMNNIAVTSGKKNGSGIGLTQVRETIQRNQGKMSIDSKIGEGTKITLTFPKVKAPNWIAEEIKLNKGDTIIILDDDDSIHHAWTSRFKAYKSEVKLKHFRSGEEAINFINTAAEKDKMFLLADFELINQELNGLQVIEQTFMQPSSILVTSHYADPSIQELAIKAGIKILPKQLAPEVPVEIGSKGKEAMDDFKKVDLVLIDDDELLVDSLADFFQSKGITVDAYYNPKCFLERLSQYAKDTKICMDNDFHSQISGIELAKQLNKNGYTQLYLFSGKDFVTEEIPSYLTVITKGDVSGLNKLLKSDK